ncbi:MAG: type 4a pilus biogenesis protein PilO [Betaproteobacteria bacterium]|nr:type 4a pilus biogenesis protein PilO [Betaproteobacteria bacterium]
MKIQAPQLFKASDLQNLSKDVGTWPLLPRILAFIATFIVVLLLGYYFSWSDLQVRLDSEKEKTEQLKKDYLDKKRQAVNLDLYTAQLEESDRLLTILLKQLPSETEVAELLVSIPQAGIGHGLNLLLFRPGPDVPKDFYAEKPISIQVTGQYHDFGAFAADIAALSRIVTLNDINIKVNSGKEGGLVMNTVAKTFRYLKEDEIAIQNKAKKGNQK